MSSKVKKRDDFTKRKEHNKNVSITVVKTCLKSFVKEKIILEPLEFILYDTNKIILEAYNIASYHAVRLLSIDLCFTPNQSFFYNCLSSVGNDNKKITDPLLQESVIMYKKLRPSNYVIPDSSYITSGILQNTSLEMETNTNNFFSMRFLPFFRKYLKHKYTCSEINCKKEYDGKKAYNILSSILDNDYKPNESSEDNNIIMKYKNMLNDLFKKHKINNIYSPLIVLPMLFHILKYNESIHEKCKNEPFCDKNVRLFSLLPNKKGFTCSHIKICNTGLCSLLKRVEKYYKEGTDEHKKVKVLLEDLKLVKFKLKTFKGREDETFKTLFHVEKFSKKHKGKFLMFSTDGKAVSITFEKPKKVINPTELNINMYDRVLGLDPGRTSVFVAAEKINDNYKFHEYKSRQYYHNAKFNENGKLIKKWVKKNNEVSSIILTKLTNKTSDIKKLEEYNKQILTTADTLLQFYGSFRIRNCRMKNYIYSQKELRKMCKLIVPNKNKKTLIGFGDWSNNGVIKKIQSGPVLKFKNMLKQYCKVVEIDEYKTSKVHHGCKCCTLEHQHSVIKKKDGSISTQKIHSVLFCTNKSCNGITMNRDKNASKNILEILVTKERPECYRRSNTIISEHCDTTEVQISLNK